MAWRESFFHKKKFRPGLFYAKVVFFFQMSKTLMFKRGCMKIFIVNGEARSGKDTFIEACIKAFKMLDMVARSASSVDRVKEAAALLGWDEVKDEKGRKFLSDLKGLSTEGYDGPMEYMEKCMSTSPNAVWFFQVREPEEIDKFVRRHPEAQTVLIRRPGNTEKFNNHADREVAAYQYDHEIINCEGEKELKCKALQFVNESISLNEFEFVQNSV